MVVSFFVCSYRVANHADTSIVDVTLSPSVVTSSLPLGVTEDE